MLMSIVYKGVSDPSICDDCERGFGLRRKVKVSIHVLDGLGGLDGEGVAKKGRFEVSSRLACDIESMALDELCCSFGPASKPTSQAPQACIALDLFPSWRGK